MKVVILAGGFGTRLSEYTNLIPKPMVQVGGKPILWHIMKSYAHFGFNDFYVALGYRSEVIKEFFLNYRSLNADITVDLAKGSITPLHLDPVDWRVTLINTGEHTMTGGRLKRLRSFVGDAPFLLTYGDGVANIDIGSLVNFHRDHRKLVTVTAVRPAARFGELEIAENTVNSFKEKPQLHEGWINGGFFVMEPSFLDWIDGDETLLERQPMERAAQSGQLMAYKHHGFWHCMDTKRDHELLEKLWLEGAPWRVWSR